MPQARKVIIGVAGATFAALAAYGIGPFLWGQLNQPSPPSDSPDKLTYNRINANESAGRSFDQLPDRIKAQIIEAYDSRPDHTTGAERRSVDPHTSGGVTRQEVGKDTDRRIAQIGSELDTIKRAITATPETAIAGRLMAEKVQRIEKDLDDLKDEVRIARSESRDTLANIINILLALLGLSATAMIAGFQGMKGRQAKKPEPPTTETATNPESPTEPGQTATNPEST